MAAKGLCVNFTCSCGFREGSRQCTPWMNLMTFEVDARTYLQVANANAPAQEAPVQLDDCMQCACGLLKSKEALVATVLRYVTAVVSWVCPARWSNRSPKERCLDWVLNACGWSWSLQPNCFLLPLSLLVQDGAFWSRAAGGLASAFSTNASETSGGQLIEITHVLLKSTCSESFARSSAF